LTADDIIDIVAMATFTN